MCVPQLSRKYLHSGSFLSPLPHSSPSSPWKGILLSQQIISQGACHRVHPQSPLPIWDSSWIPSIPSFTPSPASSTLNPPNLAISDLITPNATWNLPLLISLFDSSSVREIQKVKFHPYPVNDHWTPSPNGVFSSSSAYKLIRSHRVSS